LLDFSKLYRLRKFNTHFKYERTRELSEILDKYDESIKLTYNYTYRMLVHLKDITENFNKFDNPDEMM
jgi:hypothetical protein